MQNKENKPTQNDDKAPPPARVEESPAKQYIGYSCSYCGKGHLGIDCPTQY